MIQFSRLQFFPRFSQPFQETPSSVSSKRRQRFPQWLIAGTMTSAALLLGLVPNLHPSHANGSAAYAQSAISDAEVQNYAQTVLEIEQLRLNAVAQMRNLLGENAPLPSITCNLPGSLNNLRREIREIAVKYCEDSRQVAAGNSLPSDRFNAITEAQQSDPNLAGRINRALIQLQRGGTP
jgi:hypothetical protein